jgi:hypothetical protein
MYEQVETKPSTMHNKSVNHYGGKLVQIISKPYWTCTQSAYTLADLKASS